MTAQSKTTIKTYFESGDKPTQAQFVDLIDSYQDAAANLGTLTSAGLGAVGLAVLATTTSAAAAGAIGLTKYIVNATAATYNSNVNITAQLPYDDTIPQNTEGVEILNVSLTPKAATHRLRASFAGMGGGDGTVNLCAAMFINSDANAVQATSGAYAAAGNVAQLAMVYEWSPGAITAQTVSVRVGAGAAGTIRMNGFYNGRLFGSAALCTLVLEEIAA